MYLAMRRSYKYIGKLELSHQEDFYCANSSRLLSSNSSSVSSWWPHSRAILSIASIMSAEVDEEKEEGEKEVSEEVEDSVMVLGFLIILGADFSWEFSIFGSLKTKLLNINL